MELRELQLYKLDILKKVIRVCEDNNLTYYLQSGTLLGCIRHKGYIPWDDDIDISLKWNDYVKLIQILRKTAGEEFFVQNMWTEPKYPYLLTQIRVNNTTSLPINAKRLKMHWGMCIDIFPLISVSADDEKFEKQKVAIRLARSFLAKDQMLVMGEKAHGKQRIINMLPSRVRHFFADRIIRKYAYYDENERYLFGLSQCEVVRRYERTWFESAIKKPFEDIECNVPVGYDLVLKALYKNYMELPPESKRNGHDSMLGEIINDITKDYTTYLD